MRHANRRRQPRLFSSLSRRFRHIAASPPATLGHAGPVPERTVTVRLTVMGAILSYLLSREAHSLPGHSAANPYSGLTGAIYLPARPPPPIHPGATGPNRRRTPRPTGGSPHRRDRAGSAPSRGPRR